MQKDRVATRWVLLIVIALFALCGSKARAAEIHIDATAPGIALSPDMYGLFFEEIGHLGDGGLYAEMVQNRAFNDNLGPAGATWDGHVIRTPQGWERRYPSRGDLPGWSLITDGDAKASMALDKSMPLNSQQHHALRLQVDDVGKRAGISNEGWRGMSVVSGAKYNLSFYARAADFHGAVNVSLETTKGEVLASAIVANVRSAGWKQYHVVLLAHATSTRARLVISPSESGTIWFDIVSLFPQATWKDRPNGMRPDMAQWLADMKPSFLRYPGGCVVEGCTLANRIQWKQTIGDIAMRPGRWDLWGYYASEGLGLQEYQQFAEDLGAVGMYVVNAGFACQFRKGETARMDELEPYVQDALDGIEYLIGPSTSKWGAERAKNGHAAPFNLKYVEIGNENWGHDYAEHYGVFYAAIKRRWPQLHIIACTDPRNHLPLSQQAPVGKYPLEIADEHFYAHADYFFDNTHRYDSYDRKGPKVYVGELGVVSHDGLRGSLAEAAFLTGLERNADVVVMFSSVMLSLVRHDNSRSAGTTQYYVEKLFGTNRPDRVLPCTIEDGGSRFYVTAGEVDKSHQIIVKVVNGGDQVIGAAIQIKGMTPTHGLKTVLTSDDPTAEDTMKQPDRILPIQSEMKTLTPQTRWVFPPNSLTILRMSE